MSVTPVYVTKVVAPVCVTSARHTSCFYRPLPVVVTDPESSMNMYYPSFGWKKEGMDFPCGNFETQSSFSTR